MSQSEIIFIIFYTYMHNYIFYISWFPTTILIHLEGSSDNILWQKCHYLLISRKRKLHASYFLMKLYTGYSKYFITVYENSTGTQTINHSQTVRCDQTNGNLILNNSNVTAFLWETNLPTTTKELKSVTPPMRRRIKTFYKLGRIFTQYFLYKATLELLKTLF